MTLSRNCIPQPLTRASTAQDSEPVLTPSDITPGYADKGGYFGVANIRTQRSVGSSSAGSSHSPYLHVPEALDAIREDGLYDPAPYGPYFSLPLDPPVPSSTLVRRTTAKELINRYETLDSGRSDYSSSTAVSRVRNWKSRQNASASAEKKVKGRSPIRQSFRNLLSAIGKKAKGIGRDHSANASKSSSSICLDSPPLNASIGERRPPNPYLDIPSNHMSLAQTSASGMPACNTPTALHTGPLLYLCRPVSSNDLPVWTDCTVVLHPSHILVTWLTPQDNPSTSMVTLPQCTDVRSLAVNELDAEERGLLPTQPNKGELKVFELLFEGRVREKFAAYSVTERAGWVSAIWDALLLCQDRKSQLSSPAVSSSPPVDSPEPGTLHLDSGNSYTPRQKPPVAHSVVSSGYAGDASSVGRSPYPSTTSGRSPYLSAASERSPNPSVTSISGTELETASGTTSGRSTHLSDGSHTEGPLSPTSARSVSSLRTQTTNLLSPSSPRGSSVGFVCRTDTSALSPRPSMNSSARPESPLSPRSPASHRTTLRLESTLPALPTPPMPSPQRYSLYDPPVARSEAATPTKTSLLQTPTLNRSQSPSILNLSQTSMVRQRLAEIERTNSVASQATNTPRSSRSRQYSPLLQTPLSHTSTRQGRTGTSLRVDTITDLDEEAIINSYAESSRGGSPLSVFAGRSDRLTSAPSRQNTVKSCLTESSARESTIRPDLLSPATERGDDISPASEYSTDLLSPLPTPGRTPFANISEVIDIKEAASVQSRSEDIVVSEASRTEHRSRLSRITEAPPTPRTPTLYLQYEKCPSKEDPPPSPRPAPPACRLSRIANSSAVSEKALAQKFEDVPSQTNNGPLIFQTKLRDTHTEAPLSPRRYKDAPGFSPYAPSTPRSGITPSSDAETSLDVREPPILARTVHAYDPAIASRRSPTTQKAAALLEPPHSPHVADSRPPSAAVLSPTREQPPPETRYTEPSHVLSIVTEAYEQPPPQARSPELSRTRSIRPDTSSAPQVTWARKTPRMPATQYEDIPRPLYQDIPPRAAPRSPIPALDALTGRLPPRSRSPEPSRAQIAVYPSPVSKGLSTLPREYPGMPPTCYENDNHSVHQDIPRRAALPNIPPGQPRTQVHEPSRAQYLVPDRSPVPRALPVSTRNEPRMSPTRYEDVARPTYQDIPHRSAPRSPMPAPYVPPERSPPRSRSPDASHIQPAMPPSPVSQVASSPAENASRMPPSAVENVSSYRHDAPWSSTLQSPDTAPIVPAGAQKTPLMLALESPRSYHSPIRGPKRPTRLTKPPILAQSAPVRDTPPSLAPTSSPLLPPTPESQTSSPIEQDLVQNNLPAPSASKTSRTGGLFAALRRPRRRSAEVLHSPPTKDEHSAPSLQNGQNIVPTARNEPPIIQVVKELTIERIPGPPIIQVDEETKQIMQGVEGTVSQIVEYENWNGDQLTGIRTQVDTVLHELRHMPKPISRIIQPPSPAVSMPPPIDVAQITDRLDEMGTTLNVNLPELFGKVEVLMKQAAALQKARAVVVMKDVAAVPGEVTAVPPPEDKTKTTDPIPETLQSEQTEFEHKDEEGNDEVVGGPGESETVAPDESQVGDDSAPAEGETIKMELFDPTQLENKLDVLLALCQQLQNDAQSQPAPMAIASTEDGETQEVLSPESIEKPNSEAALRNAELQEFLELLKMDLDQRASQTDQQTDSVRYLHELNSWLEAFVNHGTSQIDNVLAGVQHLCKELGPIPELQVMQNVSHGEGRGPSQESSNLLSDIRRLLVTSQEREGNTLALEASVNGLVAAVHEELRRGAESRNTLTTESIVGLIERHRQDQERLLRNVASDLSNDIRGERLRFVEAMKEATAINVQIHVEEFKKELTREVLLMTQEVGRLQKERQTLEQQIADLFSFYAKQKQSNNDARPGPGPQRNSAPPRVHQPKPLPSMRRRPLPTPSPRPPSAMGYDRT